MSYGICNLGVVPVRVMGKDQAEIVTQLLFGEHFKVVEETEKWLKIKTAHDGYTGWICQKQWQEITYEDYDVLEINNFPYTTELLATLTNTATNQLLHIPAGSVLPNYHNGYCRIRTTRYKVHSEPNTYSFDEVDDLCKLFLNSPYLWGGRTFMGIDCSGYSQLVYRLLGYNLPRDAYQQAEEGFTIQLPETQLGDLAYFGDNEKITHVGIVLNNNQIIHASGKVRIDNLSQKGIVTDQGDLTHKLKLIKRIKED